MSIRRVNCRGICQIIAIVIIAIQANNTPAMPRFEEVKSTFQPSDVQIVDRNGELLHSLRADKSVRRGQWVALADISPALRTAMVLSEDKRFYEHSGVDWRAVSSAAWGNVWNTKTRGASTITMQLAGLLDEAVGAKTKFWKPISTMCLFEVKWSA
jgi:penicillin-binding protein 1C